MRGAFRARGTFPRHRHHRHRGRRCTEAAMDASNPQSTARLMGHPIHPMLVPFPIAFFIGALLADLAYLKTAEPFWATAAAWLLGAGLVGAALAALAGLTDFLGDRRI